MAEFYAGSGGSGSTAAIRIQFDMYRISGKALSFFKAFKTLFKRKIAEFQNALQSSKDDMIKFILDFYDLSTTNHLLEKRKQQPTSLEIKLDCLN